MKTLLLLALLAALQDPETLGYPKGTKNTEDRRTSPAAADRPADHRPRGFRVALFAGGPTCLAHLDGVRRARRLWIAECCSHSSGGP